MSFPCGCSKDGCNNPAGRIEFNPIRVRTHFIHTVMRLEIERKREQITQMCAPRSCDFDGVQPGSSSMELEEGEIVPGKSVEMCDLDLQNDEGHENEDEGQNQADGEETDVVNANSNQNQSKNSESSVTAQRRLPRKSCLRKNLPKSQVDFTKLNSNDRGSCRDCGSSEMTEMLMAGAHLGENIQLEMEPLLPPPSHQVSTCVG